MEEILKMAEIFNQRFSDFEKFSRIQMKATTDIHKELDALKIAVEMKNSDIERMKADIAIIKEVLKPGSRH